MSVIRKFLTKFVKNYFVPIQKILKILSTHTNLSENISYPYTFHSANTPGIKNEWFLTIDHILALLLNRDALCLKARDFRKFHIKSLYFCKWSDNYGFTGLVQSFIRTTWKSPLHGSVRFKESLPKFFYLTKLKSRLLRSYTVKKGIRAICSTYTYFYRHGYKHNQAWKGQRIEHMLTMYRAWLIPDRKLTCHPLLGKNDTPLRWFKLTM